MSLVAQPARAQTVFSKPANVSTIYPGAVYTYTVTSPSIATSYDQAVVDLQARLELVAIRAVNANTGALVANLFPDTSGSAGCSATAPYTCANPFTVSGGGSPYTVSLSQTGSPATQQITFVHGGVTGGAWVLAFQIDVRVLPAGTCSDPTATFSGGSGTTPMTDSSFCTNLATLTGVVAVPPTLQLTRSATPVALTVTFNATTDQGTVAPLGTVTTSCNPSSACVPGAGQILSVVDGTGGTQVTALDTPVDPSPGAQQVVVVAHHAGGQYNALTVNVGESVVTDLGLDTVPSGITQATPDQPVHLIVARARNAAGGYEPLRAASWNVAASPAPATGWGSNPPASWLTVVDAQHADLTVPAAVLQAVPGADLTVQVTAVHRNPDSSTITSAPVALHLATTRLDDCGITADRTSIGVRQRVTVTAWHRPAGGTQQPLGSAPQWQLTGGGRLLPGGRAADTVYQAPVTPTLARITAQLPAALCATTTASVQITVTQDVAVRLRLAQSVVAAGGVTSLQAQLVNTSGQPLTDVRFHVALPAVLKRVGRLPRGDPALNVRAAAPGSGTTATATATSSGGSHDVWFRADLPATTAPQIVELPLLARIASACSRGQIHLEAYRTGDTVAIAQAQARVQIACDSEFSEATLFGKVFDDANGNGVQDPGEQGIAGALVATSASVYAITDPYGRYHMVRLAAGRTAVKIDLSSLPMGARLTTDGTRVVTLTPGSVEKVSYGVTLPNLRSGGALSLDRAHSGVRPSATGLVYRARLHVDPAVLLSVWNEHGARQTVQRTASGEVTVDLPLGADVGHWLWVLRADDGRTWLYSLGLYTYARSDGSRYAVPWGPRSVARLLLPAAHHAGGRLQVAVAGQASTPVRIRVGIGSETCRLAATGGKGFPAPVHCELDLHGPVGALSLRVDTGADAHGDDPPPITAHLKTDMGSTVSFFVGLLHGEVGRVLHGKPAAGEDPVSWNAAGAFYYRGVIQGKYLISAGASLDRDLFVTAAGGVRHLGGMSQRFFAHDPERIFRSLDPEAYYPVYGDSSTSVDERQSGGRFFVRLQVDRSYVKWGAINTAIDDVEVGRYVRSLYGLGGHLDVGRRKGAYRVHGGFFAAQPDSVAARDELVVTGGSLYFLSHQNVVQGTLRVSLEVLDEVSGLPVQTVPLVEGVSYTADYLGGRITLDPTLPYSFAATSLTSKNGIGARSQLVVDYEYIPSQVTQDVSVGAHLVGRVGPVSVGATGVAELQGNVGDAVSHQQARYGLVGAQARLDLGKPLQLDVELAHSQGTGSAMARSLDGGLHYESLPGQSGQHGNAAKVELESHIQSDAGAIGAAAYGRFYQDGFVDSRRASGSRLVQGGVRADATWTTHTKLWGQLDYRAARPEGSALLVRNLALLGASQRLGMFRLGLEGRGEWNPRQPGVGAFAGARIGITPAAGLELYVRRRQVLVDSYGAGRASSETALGGAYERPSGWGGGLEVGANDRGALFGRVQGGFPLDDHTRLYVGYQRSTATGTGKAAQLLDDPTQTGDRLVAGGRREVGGGVSVYAENAFHLDGSERLASRTVGGDVPLSKNARLTFRYERGATGYPDAPEGTAPLQRDAASVGASYGGKRWRARLIADGRIDRSRAASGQSDSAEWGLQGRAEWRLNRDLSLALGWRGGTAYTLAAGPKVLRWAWEGSAGFALRPVSWDTLNVFGRYALVLQRDAPDSHGDALEQQSHIIALAAVWDLWAPFAVSPKIAYRRTFVQERGAGTHATDDALLLSLRGEVHITGKWDVSGEGRLCGAPAGGGAWVGGALAEVSTLMLGWLRLGAGYNFSEIGDVGVQCHEPGARGVFVRAEAVY